LNCVVKHAPIAFMHIRNLHKEGYNFAALVSTQPSLAKFVKTNPNGRETIDFADAQAVKMLNAALLKHYYGINFWDIPNGYLCPPVPGRADYIHALADLLTETSPHSKTSQIQALDIGTGANIIYPILGSQLYGWRFVGTDTDKVAVASAKVIQSSNACLQSAVHVRHQRNPNNIFEGVLEASDHFAFCMCNPPFHKSSQAASQGSIHKNENLNRNRNKRRGIVKHKPIHRPNSAALNFAGQNNELWCEGGEVGFIQKMIVESITYQNQIFWFTSLVSKKDSLKPIYASLKKANVTEYKTINMGQGSKVSRFVAWRF
jgi:23S rRNA (adenine1618-N6)-methyltransferase